MYVHMYVPMDERLCSEIFKAWCRLLCLTVCLFPRSQKKGQKGGCLLSPRLDIHFRQTWPLTANCWTNASNFFVILPNLEKKRRANCLMKHYTVSYFYINFLHSYSTFPCVGNAKLHFRTSFHYSEPKASCLSSHFVNKSRPLQNVIYVCTYMLCEPNV
jgi:hypothetical protein